MNNNNRELNRIVREAWTLEAREARQLQRRLENGVDRTVPSFEEVDPAILESNSRPLDALAEEVGRPSRIINWIAIVAREWNSGANVSQILKAPLAKKKRLRCPFIKPENCLPCTKYRRVDGRCNNLDHPLWGAAFTPMARLLPAQYDSGRVLSYVRDDQPRQSGKRGALPSARHVSNVVHSSGPSPVNSSLATMALPFFGQMVAHDIADTAFERGATGALLGCDCSRKDVRGCAGIDIPRGDFFREFKRKCLGFSRAKEVTDLNCEGRREQLNMMSSFLDLGTLYGQTEEVLEGLRGEDGKLKTSVVQNTTFPPTTTHPNVHANNQRINFLTAGDERMSEVIGLTGITTIMLRLHNSIAENLATFDRFANIQDDSMHVHEMTGGDQQKYSNDSSDDISDDFDLVAEDSTDRAARSNAIFRETRKISIAINQHIAYNEFLPLVIGPEAMEKFELEPQADGYFTGYDPKVNPTMTNEVIGTAMRFGHSLLQSMFSVRSTSPQLDTTFPLRQVFWRPNFYLLFENGFQRGVVTDHAEVCDRFINDEVRSHLFETNNGTGEDLIARNIQRGRDHGVPPYNAVRDSLGLRTASTFTVGGATGFQHLTADVVKKLKKVYGHPDDVDLFTGGISETPVTGGLVGPVFSKLLGEQFKRLRVGDRFWYENKENGFTLDQLMEIRKVTLARLMCDHIAGIDSIQPQAMRLVGKGNRPKKCKRLPGINLSLWENPQ